MKPSARFATNEPRRAIFYSQHPVGDLGRMLKLLPGSATLNDAVASFNVARFRLSHGLVQVMGVAPRRSPARIAE